MKFYGRYKTNTPVVLDEIKNEDMARKKLSADTVVQDLRDHFGSNWTVWAYRLELEPKAQTT